MTLGYALLFVSLVAFGLLGIFHKVADHPDCRPKMITVILLFWGGLLTTIYTFFFHPVGLVFPREVLMIGSLGGVIAAFALYIFQAGLKFGKISTSWLIINLATAIPVSLSIFLFGEKVSAPKVAGILLVATAIVLMWQDKKIDLDSANSSSTSGSANRSKWLLLMMLAFVGQGLAASSQKLLNESGNGDYVWQFYIVLYWSGFLMMALLSVMRESRPSRRELTTGLVMACCSVIGNVSITTALGKVPGSIAYPVGNGGSLMMVAIAGVLLFREKIHPIGIAGIVCGIGAILILVMA